MDLIIGDHTTEAGKFVKAWNKQIYGNELHEPYAVLLWTHDGQPTDTVLFNNYNKSSIEIHIHTTNGLTRRVIRAIYNYVFVQLKCNILVGVTPRDSVKMLKILPRLGFKYLATIPMFYGATKGRDGIMYYTDVQKFSRWK